MIRCVLTCLTSISLANVPKYVRPVMMQSTDLNELGDDVSATPWGRTIHERCSRHGQGDRDWTPGCRSLPDMWLWGANHTAPNAAIIPSERQFRAGKLWIIEFTEKDQNTKKTSGPPKSLPIASAHRTYLKLGGSHWTLPKDAVLDGESLSLYGPTHFFKSCRRKGHKPIALHWAAPVGAVLSELIVYHLDKVLGLYTVPPGKLVAYTASDMGSNFADPYLCTTPEKFSAYASSKLHPKHRILGWLSVSAPDVQKVTEVKPTRLPGCTRFCSKSALANMGGVDCSLESSQRSNACCWARTVPSRPEVGILTMFTNPCDKTVNCFSTKVAGTQYSISLDNDCLRTPTSENVQRWASECTLYPRGLRRHFLGRLKNIRNDFQSSKSPLYSAVIESVFQTLHEEVGPLVADIVRGQLWELGRQPESHNTWPPNFWGRTGGRPMAFEELTIDRIARAVEDRFRKCDSIL